MGDINVDMSDRNNTHTNYDHVQDSFSKTDSVDEQLDIIIEKYKAHPSIQKIKYNNPFLSHFSLSCATEDMILRILLLLNVMKGAG